MKIRTLLLLSLLTGLVACGGKNETSAVETAADKAVETTKAVASEAGAAVADAADKAAEAVTEAVDTTTEAATAAVSSEEAPKAEQAAPQQMADAGAVPADHPGAELHAEKCASCHIADHDEAFYTRADRKVDSYQRLGSMVRACDAQLGTALFDEDMDHLVEFLNKSYYKFSTN